MLLQVRQRRMFTAFSFQKWFDEKVIACISGVFKVKIRIGLRNIHSFNQRHIETSMFKQNVIHC